MSNSNSQENVKIVGKLENIKSDFEEFSEQFDAALQVTCASDNQDSSTFIQVTTGSFSSLEGLEISEEYEKLCTKPLDTPEGTGTRQCLLAWQREKLFQLWELMFAYFMEPFDPESVRKNKKFGKTFFVTCNEKAHLRSEIALSEKEISLIDANPLAEELFSQFGTDDPDTILLRYLRARRWSVLDAFFMLSDALKWRLNYGLRQLLMDGEKRLQKGLKMGGKNYFWKSDKAGNLVCFVQSRLHDKSSQSLQETIDFTIYSIEIGRRLRKNDEQLVTVVFDLADAPFSSLDMPALQFMLNCLQSFYPEILAKCLIKDAPWIFSGFWRIAKSLVDPNVAKKIEFVTKETLKEWIDPDSLSVDLGGNDLYQFEYIAEESSSAIHDNCTKVKELGKGEEQLLLCRLATLRIELIEITKEYHSIILKVKDQDSLEKAILPVKIKRDAIKNELKKSLTKLDHASISQCNYHRIGVLDEDWNVDWDRYYNSQVFLKRKSETRESEAIKLDNLRSSAPM